MRGQKNMKGQKKNVNEPCNSCLHYRMSPCLGVIRIITVKLPNVPTGQSSATIHRLANRFELYYGKHVDYSFSAL